MMRKLLMITAVALLALGLGSCEKGTNDDPNTGAGSLTGIRLSIAMPSASAKSRATDWNPITATAAEDAVEMIDIWVFDQNRNAVTMDEGGNPHHKRFEAAVDFNAGAGGVYTMKEPWTTVAGDVRIWVGLNLPSVEMNKDFANETALQAAFATLADLSTLIDDDDDVDPNPVKGLAMMSNATPYEFLPIPFGSTFEAEDAKLKEEDPAASFNTVTVDVFRVVSKAVATVNWTDGQANAAWKVAWTGGPTLTYTPSHWRPMQYAISSWVAPRYDVAKYNGGPLPAELLRPVTYDLAYITYANATAAGTELSFGDKGSDPLLSGNMVADKKAIYIGENSRVGALQATNGNTTYAFISTGVNVDKEFKWDGTKLDWVAKPGGYGWVSDEDDGAQNSDVILIRWKGDEYLTSSQANVSTLIAKIAELEMGALVKETPDPQATNPIEISMADFKEAQNFSTFTFTQGYAHFLHWINGIKDNQYEILRNQFIHLDVTGMNQENDGRFPGYPGDPDDPRIPIDPTEDDDPTIDNPDPIDPQDPIDPESTDVLINVHINPWTFRVNPITLGR